LLGEFLLGEFLLGEFLLGVFLLGEFLLGEFLLGEFLLGENAGGGGGRPRRRQQVLERVRGVPARGQQAHEPDARERRVAARPDQQQRGGDVKLDRRGGRGKRDENRQRVARERRAQAPGGALRGGDGGQLRAHGVREGRVQGSANPGVDRPRQAGGQQRTRA